MIGMPDNKFYGRNNLTRAEAAVIISKMLDRSLRGPQKTAIEDNNGGGVGDGHGAVGGDRTDPLDGHEDDAALFAELFPVSDDHPFIFASYEEVAKRFKSGTGVIAFAFPACPRCKNAFPVLEKAFKDMGMDKQAGLNGKILYYDIYEDREANNERYQALVGYTKEFLPLDSDGNPRIYSPDIFFVSNGKIVGHHLDTVESLTNPRDALNEEQALELANIYKGLIIDMIEDCGC
jgi:hypothetical protein